MSSQGKSTVFRKPTPYVPLEDYEGVAAGQQQSSSPFVNKSFLKKITRDSNDHFNNDPALLFSLNKPLFHWHKLLFTVSMMSLLIFLLIDSPMIVSKMNQKAIKCTHSSGKPDLQYALMMDAGSTGSRIHIYRFDYCNGTSPTLEDEIFEKVEPGLSFYESDIEAASRSLKPLLDLAVISVPAHLHACTPVSVKATAGLRLLGDKKSNAILESVEKFIRENYQFPIIEKDGVVVMDGKDEGVYAWITVNYLKNNIGQEQKLQTAAIMDLGGASTQIVFEPKDGTAIEDVEDYKYILDYGKHRYVLYQHSYLGYGLMQGRIKIKGAAVEEKKEAEFSCINEGQTVIVDYENTTVSLSNPSFTDSLFEKCESFIGSHLFSKSTFCNYQSCSFDGIHQPKIQSTFPDGDVFAFSYFYDRTFPLGLTNQFEISELKKLAENVCGLTNLSIPQTKLLQENPEWCFDLVYMYQLLHLGYELPDNRELTVDKKIEGYEAGWSLGATIYMLDNFLKTHGTCQLKK